MRSLFHQPTHLCSVVCWLCAPSHSGCESSQPLCKLESVPSVLCVVKALSQVQVWTPFEGQSHMRIAFCSCLFTRCPGHKLNVTVSSLHQNSPGVFHLVCSMPLLLRSDSQEFWSDEILLGLRSKCCDIRFNLDHHGSLQ